MSFKIDTREIELVADQLNQSEFTVASIHRPYLVKLDECTVPCDSIQAQLNAHPKNILIIDQKVYTLYGKNIDWPDEQIFQIPATEAFKGMEGVLALYDFLHQHQITKGETMIVVGGGITQDISAFVAATYKRGLNWIFFPTTLLAMSDSCIGGKAGVNYRGSKNQLALFSSPQRVLINTAFLRTLPEKDIRSGLGEILKLCITGGDHLLVFFQQCVQAGQVKNDSLFPSLIMRALAVKRAVIELDEFEQHIRKGLNYGHTIGHVIEAMTDYAIPHGIAVVLGMMIVNQLSFDQGLLAREDCLKINKICFSLIDEETRQKLNHLDFDDMMRRLQQDKKVAGDKITMIMLLEPGYLGFVKLSMNDELKHRLLKVCDQLGIINYLPA